jgi:hypothetical protein
MSDWSLSQLLASLHEDIQQRLAWVWPRRWPRRRSRSIRRRRRCSPSPVHAVAAACSSSRPSRPAASHGTGRPRLSSQSGSTPHECCRHITHPHRQARVSLVTTRPRRRSTEQRPVSAFHSAFGPGNHPLRCSTRPKTHQRPLSRRCHALAPRVHREHRDQIAIVWRPPTQPPARSFTGGFRTTAPVQAESSRWAVIRNPSQQQKCRSVCWQPVSSRQARNFEFELVLSAFVATALQCNLIRLPPR